MAAFLHDLAQHVRAGRHLSGLPGGAASYALAQLARATHAGHDTGLLLPLTVVVPTRDQAPVAADELAFWLRGSGVAVHLFPADDVRTWDGLSPAPEIPRQRLAALSALDRRDPCVLVAPARALQQRVLPTDVLRALSLRLTEGELIERDDLIKELVGWGYLSVPVADEPGTVSFRGGVVDVWPANRAEGPVRIEFFDDEIETIRALDPRTRRGIGPVEELHLLPAREAVVTPDSLRRASEVTAEAVDEMGGGQRTRRRVLKELKAGLWFPGAEDYLSALHPVVAPLALMRCVVVVEPEAVTAELERFEGLAWGRWAELEVDERPPVLPDRRFETAQAVQDRLAGGLQVGELLVDGSVDVVDLGARDNTDLAVGKGELAPVAGRLDGWMEDGWQVALAVDGTARAERVTALFQPHGLSFAELRPPALPDFGAAALWRGPLRRGFRAPNSRLAVLTGEDLFGARSRTHQRRKSLREATAVGSLSQLKAGDFIVHVVHGIGRFEGLRRLKMPVGTEEIEQDFAELSYRGGDRMLLPVSRLDQLYGYRATGDRQPTLDKLGGQTWSRRKARAKDKIAALAQHLLRVHALREVVEGHAYEGVPSRYRQFEETFPHVETPDQERAIQDVLTDLEKPEPMDRLIVGDVGFGKTEVAMRAAMRVVLEGRQVAVLCPTTVLAFQHFQTFTERFAGFGIEVALLSSFRSGSALRQLRKKVAEGQAAIAIGTTSLLGRSTRFADLGLVIVDEEHRFGVKQKEKLKRLAQAWSEVPVDYLAMSATPIPRSLHMAMSGLRKVSLITTPPAGRRAVQTRVMRWNDARIREEILHELRRGGQCFFLHNRVQSIERVASRLRELVPEARFAVAHGQMEDSRLEKVLVDFVQREYHVLVCTTIVESGVDIPTMNTILINRADMLGLAQLYQLRGRVGRSTVRGSCTLLLPEDSAGVQKKAMERLRVLQDNTELGAGFKIASADMELRGAGDLLGESQHGHIQAIGLDTYIELLEEAVATARGDLGRQRLDPELEIPVPALIPELYIEDVQERLQEYQRLAACRTVHEVRDVIGGWEDTFGEPPPEVLNLGWQAEAKVRARELGVERVAWLKVQVTLDFHTTTPVPPEHIAALVQRESKRFSLHTASGSTRLGVRFDDEEAQYPYRFLHWVFRRLERGVEEGAGAGVAVSAPNPTLRRPGRPAPPKREIVVPQDQGGGPKVVRRKGARRRSAPSWKKKRR